MPYKRPCESCNELFLPNGQKNKKCSPCIKKSALERSDKYWAEWGVKNKFKWKKKIAEIKRKAYIHRRRGEAIGTQLHPMHWREYGKIVKIIRNRPPRTRIDAFGMTFRDWENIVMYFLRTYNKISRKEIQEELCLNDPSYVKYVRVAIKSLEKRKIAVESFTKPFVVSLYEDKRFVSSNRKGEYADYFICPACKKVSTKEDQLEVKEGNGMAFYCYCDFIKGGKFIKLKRLSKSEYEKKI